MSRLPYDNRFYTNYTMTMIYDEQGLTRGLGRNIPLSFCRYRRPRGLRLLTDTFADSPRYLSDGHFGG